MKQLPPTDSVDQDRCSECGGLLLLHWTLKSGKIIHPMRGRHGFVSDRELEKFKNRVRSGK